jgi:hypothetical protein
MKCGEPKPGGTYETCDRDLKHAGNHAYLNQRWPRPVGNEPDWEIQEMLDEALSRRRIYAEGPSFPIIVTETVTRVLWVEAEDEDHALAYYGDDPTEVPLRDTEVLDGYLEFERPDTYQRKSAFESAQHGRKIGPLLPCPDCGRESFGRSWFHDPYRKCHGPIQWRKGGHGKPIREYQQTPAHNSAREAVAR